MAAQRRREHPGAADPRPSPMPAGATGRSPARSQALDVISASCTPVAHSPLAGTGQSRDSRPAAAPIEPRRAEALAPKPQVDPKLPGCGIPARRIAVILVWARRFSQVGFFALFMYFLFQTAFRGTFAARADTPVRLPLPGRGVPARRSLRRRR